MKLVAILITLVSCTVAFNLKPSFDRFDGNKDGYISSTEWNLLYSAFDENSDGNVAPVEFVRNWVVMTGLSPDAALQLFFLIDENSDSVEQVNEHVNAYQAMDINRDGRFSYDEYVRAMSVLSQLMVELVKMQTVMVARFDQHDTSPKDGLLSLTEMRSLYAKADANGDGQITQAEFMTYWQDNTQRSKENGRLVFNLMDSNMDGFVGINSAEMTAVFNAFDNNNDGVVSKDELKSALNFIHAEIAKVASKSQ